MKDWSSMSEEDKKWRGRNDARTLAEAETIKADKVRYANAITQAQNVAEEEIQNVKGIAKVANVKLPKVCKHNNEPPAFTPARSNNQATIGKL